ncbi:sugar transferase [Nodularia spumigena CS-591/12]|uniref:sugar transferase n=1 Tax=Cyanophyceae TaxID=3028117 RepID=UPI00232B8DF7|nr:MULTISPECIES: sugar transferase [Cyanophyceae]MDB9306516.1 sugar transferase [Nodularia spumigena CS-591/12]MDB9348122.1 sugar transferase [Nodularia spumigena CS-588/01]MDB9351229.1 sugar transferase [Nodularia spumigena CS-588/05]MDB9399006.1 sugar transferase [Microcystis aeruginosa CS-567/02-A1]
MATNISVRRKKLSETHNLLSQNIISLVLLFADILGLILSSSVCLWLRRGENLNSFDPFMYLFALLIIAGLYLADTYHPDTQISGLRAPSRILISNVVVGCMIASLIYLTGASRTEMVLQRGTLLPSLGVFTIWAMVSRIWAAKWTRAQAENSRWLILGADKKAMLFGQNFLEQNSLGCLLFLTPPGQKINELLKSNRVSTGSLNDLLQWSQQPWSGVIVATELSDEQTQELIQLRLSGVSIYKIPDICETLWYKLPSSLLQMNWLAFGNGFNLAADSISQKTKRLTDIILAWLLLLFLSPLMLVAAIAIKLNSRGPVFYTQMRTGWEGKPFRVYKFRSMYQDAEKRGAQWAGKQDPRITKVGRLLRLTRIDELPQILNVLRGEMSLIGPRPERPEFDVKLREEIPYYDLRYVVKPGITGWAQVMYPYGSSVEDAYEKLAYDLYYIKNYSLALDLAIFFKTIRVVLLGKGR